MVQVFQQSLTFEMFVTQYGDDEHYELIDGELIDMEPTGSHEQVAGLINVNSTLKFVGLSCPILFLFDV